MESGDLSNEVFDVAAALDVFEIPFDLDGPLKYASHSFLQDLNLLVSSNDRSWCCWL